MIQLPPILRWQDESYGREHQLAAIFKIESPVSFAEALPQAKLSVVWLFWRYYIQTVSKLISMAVLTCESMGAGTAPRRFTNRALSMVRI